MEALARHLEYQPSAVGLNASFISGERSETWCAASTTNRRSPHVQRFEYRNYLYT
jgi:hypothetical protein